MKTKKNYAKEINKCLGVPIWNESVTDKLVLNQFNRKQVIQYHCEDLICIKTFKMTDRLERYTSDILKQIWAED